LPNGKYHRLDGPAFCGRGRYDYYINGEKISIEDFWKKMKNTRHAKSIMADILGSKKV